MNNLNPTCAWYVFMLDAGQVTCSQPLPRKEAIVRQQQASTARCATYRAQHDLERYYLDILRHDRPTSDPILNTLLVAAWRSANPSWSTWWTSYPIPELGDDPNDFAPVRPLSIHGVSVYAPGERPDERLLSVTMHKLPHSVNVKIPRTYIYTEPSYFGDAQPID